MKYKRESDIITAIEEALGRPWKELFALDSGLVGNEEADGQVFLHMIDDDQLANAALRLLRIQGKTRNASDA